MADVLELPEHLDAFAAATTVIACPLCQGFEHEPVYEGIALRNNELTVVVCRGCGHLHINPRPPISAYKEFYLGQNYFRLCADFSHVSLEEKLEQFESEEYWKERFTYGERLRGRYLIDRVGADDLVVDLGCGDGAWLWALQELTGCRVAAQEISDVYADVISRRLGIATYLGPIEEVGDAMRDDLAGTAKLVIVSGSLQHMLDPVGCLRLARNLLTPDGLLFICNWSIFEHYMAPFTGEGETFYGATRRLVGEILSWEHPHYFHDASFRFMAEVAGFEVLNLDVESTVRPRHMDLLARPLTRPGKAVPTATATDVVARLRALESAVIASRLSDRVN